MDARSGRTRRQVWVTVAVVVTCVTGAIAFAAVTYEPPPRPLPSLFGYDAERATEVLEEAGLEVDLRQARSCEPLGLVLATEPRVGTVVERGTRVVVRTAVPSDPTCLADYAARSQAWRFVAFSRGGDAPAFADSVTVTLDDGEPEEITRAEDPDRWGRTLDVVEAAASAAAPTRNGMASLTVLADVPPTSQCGQRQPETPGERTALRLQIDPARDDTTSLCPVTVDLFTDEEDLVDAVLVFSTDPRG